MGGLLRPPAFFLLLAMLLGAFYSCAGDSWTSQEDTAPQLASDQSNPDDDSAGEEDNYDYGDEQYDYSLELDTEEDMSPGEEEEIPRLKRKAVFGSHGPRRRNHKYHGSGLDHGQYRTRRYGGRDYEHSATFDSVDHTTDGQKLVMMPSLEEQPQFQGSSFFVSCFSEATNVQRLMWTNPEGSQITDYKGRIHVEDGRQGNRGVDLVMENITRQDRGKYTCSANVDGVEESVSFTLLVHKLIDFQNTPAVQYLEEGSDSELTCNVDGDPEPTVTWKAHGRKINYDDKYQHGSRENNLLVTNVTLEDRGIYQCSAVQLSTHISEFKNFNIDVKVHHKPLEDEDGMKEAYSFIQGRVNLTCGAVAEPQANFTWLKDSEIIVPSDTVQIFTDEHQSVLQLTVNDQDQFGAYLCKAENKMGTMERVIMLTEGIKPPTPEFKVTSADVNALHLDLRARDPDLPILAYRVQYKESGNEWQHAHAIEFKKGDEYVINNLKQNTLYVLRAAAKNAAGYSDFTDHEMQRTAMARTASQHANSSKPSATPLFSLALVLTFFGLAARL